MACHNPGCLGNYDFDRISSYARKRFIEGHDTIELMEQAGSEREKEEIALVSLLDVEDDVIQNLRLTCKYADQCKVTNCREKLKEMLEASLANESGGSNRAPHDPAQR